MNLSAVSVDRLLKLVGDAPLQEVALDAAGKSLPLTKDFSITTDGVTFTAKAGTGATIALFRAPGGADPDGLVVDPKAEKGDDDALPPPLSVAPGRALLKYRCGVNLAATAGKKLADWGFNIDAKAESAFAFYSDHAQAVRLSHAARYDLDDFKHPFSVDELRTLEAGDAVAWTVSGQLSAQLTFNAADLVAGNFSLLRQALDGAGLVKGTFSAGVKVKATARASDTFIVCFSRDSHPGILVSVRKARTRQLGAGIAADLTVEFARDEDTAGLIDEVFQKLLQADQSVIDSIRAKAGYDDLGGNERFVVDQLIDQLPGKAAVTDRLKTFKALVKRLEKAVRQGLENKLTAAWTYDYQRVSADETVLVARLGDSALARFHDDLLRLRLDEILAAARSADPEVDVQRLLQKRTDTVTHTWGFSLGFGRFTFGGKESRTLRRVVRRNLDGHERLLFEGVRRRDFDTSWQLTGHAVCGFEAAMREFKARPAPGDFDFTLKLGWELENLSSSNTRLGEALDEAAQLGAIADTPRLARAQALQRDLDLARWTDAKLIASLELDADATARFMELAGNLPFDVKVQAFGSALAWLCPGGKEETRGRETSDLRRALYAGIFANIFNETDSADSAQRIHASHLVAEHLRKQDPDFVYKPLIEAERASHATNPSFVFGLLSVENHKQNSSTPGFDQPWDQALAALSRLAAARTAPHASVEVVPQTIQSLQKLWSSPFYVRALAWTIGHLAIDDPTLAAGLTRSAALKGKLDGIGVSHPLG